MSKVICDICGTAYPSNMKNCPVCGSSREYALDNMEDGISQDAAELFAADEIRSEIRKKSREIFDFDEVNQVKHTGRHMEEEDLEDEDDEYDEAPRTNVGLVIVLVVLIVLLLLASGFFFLRYILPNMQDEPVQTEPVVTTQPLQTEPVETTQPTIPCTNLSMDGGKMELGKDGKKLLNVRIYPENTTDILTYTSGDENIVTVSEDGTVSAVGEGQTVITIQCGSQQITCNVTVDYAAAEATVSEGEIPAPEVGATDATESGAETEATEETGDADATEATEATDGASAEEQVLKLKMDDITISSNYTSVQLELEGDINPEDVDWFTMDSTVAICHDGLVTSTGSGLTRIYGEYDGQQVMCIIRCIF